MSYYSDYDSEPEENDGNLESKWDPVADMNIISAVMKVARTILPEKEDFGRVLNANYRKEGDGVNMSARMEISTHMWTITWGNIDSPNSKRSSIVFSPTEERKEIEKSLVSSTNWAELEKLFWPEEVN